MQYTWLNFFDTKEQFDKLFNYIYENSEILIGTYVVIQGSLKCIDGRKIGKEGELLTAIVTITFKKEPVEKMINEGISNELLTIQFIDLAPEELISTKEGAHIIKKAKLFKGIKEFKNYLRKINFDI